VAFQHEIDYATAHTSLFQTNHLFQKGSGFLLLNTILSALACNLFITGLNQWADVEIDKINKPWLPIPAGLLMRKDALTICLVSLFVSLTLAYLGGGFLLGLISIITLIGVAYSLPPIKFKMHHMGAAIAISTVRGLLVNIGFILYFQHYLSGNYTLPSAGIPLILFITAFSIGIAWFKDIPDIKGDRLAGIKTLPLNLSAKGAFLLGAILIAIAYVFMILNYSFAIFSSFSWLGLGFHTFALFLFIYFGQKTDVNNNLNIRKFYKFFWVLFFAEYLAFPFFLL